MEFSSRTPYGVPHAFQAITTATCVSFITLPRYEAKNPITYINLIHFGSEYSEIMEDKKCNENLANS